MGEEFECLCNATDNLNSSLTITYNQFPETNLAGTYTNTCTATDDAGNSATADVGYTIKSSSGGSGGGGISGGSSFKQTIYGGKTGDIGTIKSSKVGVYAYRNSNVTFSVGSSPHKAHVDEVNYQEKYVKLTISSDPITITVNEGESKLVDLDGDGIDDLEVTIESISASRKADISFKYLTTNDGEGQEETSREDTITTGGDDTKIEKLQPINFLWILLFIIAIIIIVV